LKTLLAAAGIAAVLIVPAQAEANSFVCQFEDFPRLTIIRHDPSNWTLRVGKNLPVKLYVGSDFMTTEYQGQELIIAGGPRARLWMADVEYKGTCR
jgi:hypothetical protein